MKNPIHSVSISCFFCLFTICVYFTSCSDEMEIKGSEQHIKAVTSAIKSDALLAADKNQGNWLSYGRNYQEDRYSELDKISKENIANLGLAWSADLGTKRGIQSTPLVVDGIMFFTTSWSVAHAYDARTGKEIWKYDPNASREKVTDYCCGVVNRGMAIYEGDLFLGALDGRLISIDAATGKPNWEVNTIPDEGQYSITGAPRIVNGNVIIGNGGAEFSARGFVTAYDAKTGEQQWRFYTVPGDPSKPFEHPDLEDAAKTWNGEWWKQGGGGTVWDAMAFDPELNTLYIGVGNGTHWNREIRSPGGGDNLYLSSIVALDADNGAYKWHFQTTPGDTWDYTATQHLILADLDIEGEKRKVIMQAPKNGFFYVIDRVDGSFISGEAFTYMNWADGLDENGRPIEREGARYTDGRTHYITPSSHGGHNWFPMSYNHKTGLVYIPTSREAGAYQQLATEGHGSQETLGGRGGANVSFANKLYVPPVFDTHPDAPQPGTLSGRLIAWDPVKQEQVWSVDHVLNYNGGLLTTATGLLFQADATGTFSARDIDTGDALWQFDIRSGGIASPVTYMVDGEQYVTILVGWGGFLGQSFKAVERIHPGTIYTFKLGGNAEAPAKLPSLNKQLTAQRTDAAPEHIGRGFDVFTQTCIGCHMTTGQGGGAIPDLATSSDEVLKNYDEIVLNGMLASQGMPRFDDLITKEELDDIKAYVLYTAQAFSEGMDPVEYMTNLATFQYMSEQKFAKLAD